jgi:hypothetical protein
MFADDGSINDHDCRFVGNQALERQHLLLPWGLRVTVIRNRSATSRPRFMEDLLQQAQSHRSCTFSDDANL